MCKVFSNQVSFHLVHISWVPCNFAYLRCYLPLESIRSHSLMKLVSLQLPNSSPGFCSFFLVTTSYWRFPQPSGIPTFVSIASRTCKQFITIYLQGYNSFISKWKRCIWQQMGKTFEAGEPIVFHFYGYFLKKIWLQELLPIGDLVGFRIA